MDRQFDTLNGYLALSRKPGIGGVVDDRTLLLVRQLAAERSGCRWCIEHAQHDWRAAGLPVDLLRRLGSPERSSGFSDAERAALAPVDAVPSGAGARAITVVRRHYCERATAELIGCIADHHLSIEDPS